LAENPVKIGKKKKKKGLSYLWIFLIGVPIGVILAVLDVDMGFLDIYSLSDFVAIFILFYVGVFLTINLHELGHLLFGKLLGYQFLMFRAGIFSIQKENGKLRFSIIKNVGYGGLCAMIPDEDATMKEYAVYSLGGIIMNLLTGGLFLYLSAFMEPGSIWKMAAILTGGASILLGIVNGFPFFSMNQPTDGMMFFSILRNSPMAERFYESTLLTKKLSSGIRPRDLDLLKDFENIGDMHDLTKAFYLYFQEMDKGNRDSAEEYLLDVEKNLHKVPPYSLPAYYYELLFFELLSGNLEKAKVYHEKAGKILMKDQDINGLRVKAYYAFFMEKDAEKAKALAQKGLVMRDHYPFKGQAVYEAELLNELLQRIETERQGQ